MSRKPESLVAGVRASDRASIAEALALVEDSRPECLPAQRELLARLEEAAPWEHGVVGLTGPPGVGKSSLASALIPHWLRRGGGVGVVAVDPSSRRSGGALLGDRARLRFAPEDRVFVRSMAARDRLGGLAPATRAVVAVLRAAFEWTLVETVGVGQSEMDVGTLADSVVLVLQPDSGDTLQFMKAGIMEIPDVIVVHKWDLGAAAERTRADVESILKLTPTPLDDWQVPVLGVSAASGQGVPELVEALERHRAALLRSGKLVERRAANRRTWALELFVARYGSFGLDRLGGRIRAEEILAEQAGTALDAFSALATRAELAG